MPPVQFDGLRSTQANTDHALMRVSKPGVFRNPEPSIRRRRGFSLVELMLITGLVCVLISLLLPAVQQAREAARRTQCKHRLAQLSVAILSYQDMHTVFPPGSINDTGPIVSEADGLHTSWLLQILPMMDQPALALRHNPEVSVYDEQHAKLRSHSVRNFLCPSDVFPAVTDGKVALSNYAGVTGGADVVINDDNTGVFFLNSSVRSTDIFDGSSNQVAMAERRRSDLPSGADLGWMSGTSATLRNGAITLNSEIFSAASGPAQYETTGGFGSQHYGGAQVALADGSVRFISENIDMNLLRHLCSIHDGHDVDDF